MHAQKGAQCWTAGWGDVTHYNEEPVQLQTLKVFLYNEDQCYNHSLDFTGGFDYYDYFTNEDEADVSAAEDNYYNETEASDFNRTVDHFNFNPEVEFCAGHWDGEGPGFKSYQ